jgi:hypothetical protein
MYALQHGPICRDFMMKVAVEGDMPSPNIQLFRESLSGAEIG